MKNKVRSKLLTGPCFNVEQTFRPSGFLSVLKLKILGEVFSAKYFQLEDTEEARRAKRLFHIKTWTCE